MRFQSLVAMALLPIAACGGSGTNPAEDASTVDADPTAPDAKPGAPDAKPGETPDAAQSNCTPVRGTKVATQLVAAVNGAPPLLVTSPPGDPRLFVVHQDGKITIVKDGEPL